MSLYEGKKYMKVVYFLGSLNRTAPNTVILNIILNIDIDKIKIISLNKSKDDNYKSFLDEKGIEYYEYNSFKYAFFGIFKIKKELESYDLVHLNTYHPNVFGYILSKIGLNKRYIATCHAVENQEAVSSNKKAIDKFKSFIRLNLHKYIYKRQDLTVGVSQEVEKYLDGIRCKNAMTIYNGVDYENFPLFKNKEPNKIVIDFCQVGHVINLKNQMFSIQLIEFLKHKGIDSRLHIFGDFNVNAKYYSELTKYINNGHLKENIIFYGNLQFKELFDRLQDMDILMMPSFSEGLPLGLIEAFYFQLPAIVSKNGGMKEIVKDNINGLVIDIENTTDYEKIYQYISSQQYINDGKSARKMALNKYSSQNMAAKYFQEYKKLL